MNCKLCHQPVQVMSSVEWHPDCWVEWRCFITDDFTPLVDTLRQDNPVLVACALDDEFKAQIESAFVFG